MNKNSKVFNILKELSGVESFDETSDLHSDLALDSLNMVTLLVEVEDKYGITLKESDMNPFNLITVADVVALVSKYGGDDNEA